MIARSLREIASAAKKGKKLEHIALRASQDLVCTNLMCEKVMGPCICKLERVLQGVNGVDHVRSIDISDNALSSLPPSLANFKNLVRLDLSENKLESMPDFLDYLESDVVILDGNPMVQTSSS
jgi:Leucine-rich repeat (LRR) protein